jgi:hypothetical protein
MILDETFKEVAICRKAGILINTFMLASDRYLVEFVKKVTEICKGKAYFTTTMNLGEYILMDYLRRRRRRFIDSIAPLQRSCSVKMMTSTLWKTAFPRGLVEPLIRLAPRPYLPHPAGKPSPVTYSRKSPNRDCAPDWSS